ncbi:type IV pilin protein [Marinobacter bohaiensis]|uniref:type IV pilin protein n=1 Tax=Marinobacter bohaiensis TaxID=2201898 RepID=UPI000DACCAB6|nr:type IV pilin protein [Marinobacter bohaiensis]
MRVMQKQAGFTLMSLLIAVAIIGILSAIAWPNYQQYVQKSRRTQAESCLVEFSQYMERFRSTQMRYDQAGDGTANTLPGLGCTTESGLDSFYDFAFVDGSLSQRAYTLSATPKAGQADDECGTLTLTQASVRGADSDDCW